MAMLADVVDAVIGGDTHRDTHTLEMTTPAGATITTITVGNDEPGSSRRWRGSPNMPPVPAWWWGWKAPAATGSGWRRGKSDPIDAHLAAVHVLQLDADRLPTPRADGAREALRILLGARAEITTARTTQINRLRALLLCGDDTDRRPRHPQITQTLRRPRDLPNPQHHRHHHLTHIKASLPN